MRLPQFYSSGKPTISFEIFPPKTEKGAHDLEARLPQLVALDPAFITVTYGALGSTRGKTLDLALRIVRQYQKPVAHHLTCVCSTREDIDRILGQVCEAGIENVVALRGDPPRGESEFKPTEGGFRYASELVDHIRRTTELSIGIAGYPEKHIEARTLDEDVENLRRKAEVGGDVIFTQLFYDNAKYYSFVDRCRKAGITQPIIPGLMPILNLDQITRIVGLCGASIPPAFLSELQEAQATGAVQSIGTRHAIEQALDLLQNGAPGIHFYVLNQSAQITDIMGGLRSAFAHI